MIPLAGDSLDAVSGDSTQDNPYSGLVTELDTFAYYEIGTTFDVQLPISNLVITPGFGLSLSSGHLTGTLTAGGVCFIDEWNLIDKAEHHWTINVPCVFDGGGMAINPVAGEFTYTSQISSYGDINTCLREIGAGGTSYSELQWTVDGDDMYVIQTSGLYDYDLDYWTVLYEYLDSGVFHNRVEVMSIDFENHAITMRLSDLNGSIVGIPSLVPTYFVVDGQVVWKIFEVEEYYESTSVFDIPTPTKDGYIFTGWYEDEACSAPWEMLTKSDWEDPSIVSLFDPARFLYAGWEPDPSAIPELEFTSEPSDGDIEYVG